LRAIDILMRILVVVTAIEFLLPPEHFSWILPCISLSAVGLWGLIFPSGIMGWAKRSHRKLDPTNESLWWIPRLIGVILISISIVIAIMIRVSR